MALQVSGRESQPGVADTTGCGDACSAGFIMGLLRIIDLEGTLDVIRQHAPAEVTSRLALAEP